ncbi:MAG: PAS domain S-box protein [Anaerolineae bacterium]|nr:PAS domain S-box protein [Anaerolineae bacterium]
MIDPLKVLIVEDLIADAELLARELQAAGIDLDWQCVQTEQDFLDRLRPAPDVILANYSQSQINVLQALHLLRERNRDIPLIVVANTATEVEIVECMRHGASDFVIKERMNRLGPAVTQALKRKEKHTDKVVNSGGLYYEQLAETAHDIIIAHDMDGHVIYANRAAAELGGYEPEEVLTLHITDFVPQEYLNDVWRRSNQRSAGNDQRFLYEVNVTDKTGRTVPLEANSSLLVDSGEPSGVLIVARDITARKQMEQTLRDELYRNEQILQSILDGYLLIDMQGQLIDVNSAYCKLVGYSRDELLQMTIFDIEAVRSPEDVRKVLVTLVEQGSARSTTKHQHRDGGLVELDVRGVVMQANGQNLIAVFVQDISERRHAEAALKEGEERFRAFMDHNPALAYILDEQGCFIYGNNAWAAQFGQPVESLLGKTAHELYSQEDARMFEGIDLLDRLKDKPVRNIVSVTGIDGLPRWWLSIKFPLEDRFGNRLLGGFALDISEQKQAELALHQHSKRLEILHDVDRAILLQQAPECVACTALRDIRPLVAYDLSVISVFELEVDRASFLVCLDPDDSGMMISAHVPLAEFEDLIQLLSTNGIILIDDVQDAAYDFFPLEDFKATGGRSFMFLPLLNKDELIGFMCLVSNDPGAFEPDHLDIAQEVASQVSIAIEQERLRQQIARYTTGLEQLVVERTADLQKSEERFRRLAQNAQDIIYRYRLLPDPAYEYVSPAATLISGYTPEEHYADPDLMTTLVHPDDRELLRQVSSGLPREKPLALRWLRKDGVEIWTEQHIIPVHDDAGNLIAIEGIVRDITRRKQHEDILRQALAREMDVSNLKSRFVSMAAHDLRNPLAVIQTTCSLLTKYEDRFTPEQKETKYDRIQAAIDAMVDLLDDILIIGRVEQGKLQFNPQALNLSEFCYKIVSDLRLSTDAGHNLVFSCADACNNVYMDPKLVRQIVDNLLSNAIKYTPANSRITIDIRCENEEAVFVIQDTGIGIPAADQRRLFEAFQRGANVGQIPGTGLGLAIVKQSVELHGGTITFDSQEGMGTTFTVVLPTVSLDDMIN